MTDSAVSALLLVSSVRNASPALLSFGSEFRLVGEARRHDRRSPGA